MIALSKFLTVISVGIKKKKLIVKVPVSYNILSILWCLYKNNYISGYNVNNNIINIYLKYYQGKNILIIIKQISKISCRIYFKYNKLLNQKKINNNYIISTSKGIILTENITKKERLGGEIFFKIR